MRTLGRFAIVALLLVSSAAVAEVTVQEQAEAGPVGVGDPFQLTVSVTGAQRQVGVQLPPGDFQVLGKSHGTQLQMSSGPSGMETTRSEQFVFTLAANRAGTLSIPAAQVTADGAVLLGEPTSLEVQRGHVAREKSPDDDDADPLAQMMQQLRGSGLGSPFGGSAMRNFFGGADPFAADPFRGARVELHPGDVRLEAVADRKSAHPGEQITVSYYLTTRVPISSVNDLQIPAFDGAAMRNIELGKQLVPEEANGVARVLVQKRALFANAAGTLKIKSATARVSVGDQFSAQEVAVASAPLTLSIEPLPPGPKNATVGRWSLALSGDATARAGEPLTLRITAQGLGDASSLPEPPLALPSSWKSFPSSTRETDSVSAGRIGGTRTWERVVIPAGEGKVALGPVSLEEYEPQSGRYLQVSSAPLQLELAPAAAPSTPDQEKLPDAKSAPAAASLRSQLSFPNGLEQLLIWPAALLFLLALVLLAIGILRKRADHADRANPRPARLRDAEQALQEAHGLCRSERASDFFAALTRALNALASALGAREAATAELPAIVSALKGNGLAAPACDSVSRALEACRRFAFLRATDSATLHRTLTLADEAFSAIG